VATLKAIATGDFTTASTWAVCNATAELDSEASSTNSTTSYVASQTFTPGAITISAIMIKVITRAASATGTFSVELFNSTAGTSVSGTEVTINATDIPETGSTDGNAYWTSFKFASNVTLLAATAYSVRIKGSVASNVTVYRNATAGNWTRQLVTTTTAAPGVADKLLLTGDWTGAGSLTSYTVTMNNTATTEFGSNEATVSTFHVGNGMTLTWGTTAATNYYLKIKGNCSLSTGGTINIGTTGTPMPRDSTAVWEIAQNAVDVNYGIDVRGGTLNIQGQSRSSGKIVDRCLLNTDEAIASTSLGVDTDTGWLSGDEIVIAGTNNPGTKETETRTLSGAAGASTLTISSGLTFAHDGSDPLFAAEVALLTRNIEIRSDNASFNTFMRIRVSAVCDFDWVSFKWLGSNTANKRGLDLGITTGSLNMNYCVSRAAKSKGVYFAASCVGVAIDNMICALGTTGAGNMGYIEGGINTVGANSISNTWIIDHSAFGYYTLSNAITLNNVRVVSSTNGFQIADIVNATTSATFNDLYARSVVTTGFSLFSVQNITITNLTARRCGTGLAISSSDNTTIRTGLVVGNSIGVTLAENKSQFYNCVFASETGYSQQAGISFNSGTTARFTYVENSTFGVVSGLYGAHTTSDLRCGNTLANSINTSFRNCDFASSSEFTNLAGFTIDTKIVSERHDQTNNSLTIWYRNGIVTKDTSISTGGSPSYRLTPNTASAKLDHVIFRAAVSGGTTATVSVKVRESVVGDGTDYNGARIRLIVKANSIAGITTDTVLATATSASEGAFETITGTTATVTNTCVLEFCVDCDGTTGWINVDDITPPTAVNTLGLAATDETLLWSAVGNNSSGGGSSATVGYAGIC
jgi:hypothetical protein